MAQRKVIDFYPTTKWKPDQQSSKRRKINDASSLFSITDQKTETKITPHEGSTKHKVRTSTRKHSRKASSKTQPKTTSISQKPITDFLPQPPEASKSLPLVDKEDFTFKKASPVPLKHAYVSTEYTANSISPSTTPKKRIHELKPTTASKRKRRTECAETPSHSDITKSLEKEVLKSVRKKLVLPETQSPDNENQTSKQVNEEVEIKLDNENNQDLIPSKHSANKITVEKITKEHISDAKNNAQWLSKPEQSTKKSTTTEMKEKLKKCGQLADMKNSAKKVGELIKDIRSKKSLRTEQKVEEDGKAASVEKQPEPTRSEPAYERHRELVDIPPSLTLPYKYKLLEAMFKGTDTIVSMLHNRLELCTFNKLKQGVQNMIRRRFEPHHLGQIKTVYPNSYKVTQEKGVIENGGMKSNCKYTMCIEAPLDVNENSKNVSRRKDGRPVFSSNQVMMRKQTFKQRLYDICKQHHQAFLEKLEPPIHVDAEKLTRWHSDFPVEKVPDIESVALPKPPNADRITGETAQQVLEKCRGKVPSRIEQALKKVAEASNNPKVNIIGSAVKIENNKTANNSSTANKASTAGISSSLLERIRAKEAMKAQAAMLRDEEAERELEMLDRLPEIIKIIRSCYITEKKPALLEDIVVVKVCDSYKTNISQATVEKHLTYIQKIFPKWMQKVKLSSGTYLKLNRETELSILNSEISRLVKQKQYI